MSEEIFWSPGRPFRFQARKELGKALPEFFDFLALGISGGKNLEQAFLSAVPQVSSSALREALDLFSVRLHLGLSCEAVFESFRDMLGTDPSSATVGLLLQALRHGSPIESVLRDQAESLRRQHQLELEKKAQMIGLKLLIPIGLFLLPALLLLFFGGFSLMMKQGGGLFNF